MTFQSFHFLVFFLFVLFIARYVLEKKHSAKKNFLLFASYYFYMCWDWRFAGLLLLITGVSFIIGPKIEKSKTPYAAKAWLSLSIVSSLAILAYFKYMNFFIEGMNQILVKVGFNNELPYLNILLPVGISFYTFQSISYTLDIYRGKTKTVTNFRDFALFVSFFPQLVAGPIVRASHFLPQLEKNDIHPNTSIEQGIALIIRGFLKKIAIADTLAIHIVDPAFATPENYSPLFLILGIYAYSFQVYMDFSGYTDIARGIAKTLGFELQINFNRPYKATSISNFWQRWHISMSSFFRDYLYFGLGGSKHGNVYINLLITFIMIGIWHGAGLNFVIYGMIHGSLVCLERFIQKRKEAKGIKISKLQGVALITKIFWIFNLVALSRLLFRGENIDATYRYFNALFDFSVTYTPLSFIGFIALTVAIISHYLPDDWTFKWKQKYQLLPVYVQAPAISVIILFLLVISNGSVPFVYFQF